MQFLSITILGIARIERNAKFVKNDTQYLCMVIQQRKVRLSGQMVTPQKNQKEILIAQQLTLNLTLLVCV